MKKGMMAIAMCVVGALALCSCGSKEAVQETAATETTTETGATTQVAESQTERNNQNPRRVEPLPATRNMDALNDCTVDASFDKSDISKDGDEIKLHITVYDYELFDMVDISLLKEGDILVIDGVETPVESVERNEYGLVSVNGGQNLGGYDLYTDDNGVYYEALPGDGKSFYTIGDITLPLSHDFVFTDSSDLEAPEKTYTAEEFANWDSYDDFINLNTTVTISDGSIQAITKRFRP